MVLRATRTVQFEGDYAIVGLTGEVIPIDKRTFDAFKTFIQEKRQGSVTVSFLSGGIRGVKSEQVHS